MYRAKISSDLASTTGVQPSAISISTSTKVILRKGQFPPERLSLICSYFSDADMARTSFSLQHFPDFLIGNLKDHLALGGISCNFTAEIRPYERFVMETKLLCWDDKWIFLSTRFLGPSGKAIDRRAQSLAQYVFKAGRRTIKPEEGESPLAGKYCPSDQCA